MSSPSLISPDRSAGDSRPGLVRIAAVAGELDLSPRTVRRYIQGGLLGPVPRGPSGRVLGVWRADLDKFVGGR